MAAVQYLFMWASVAAAATTDDMEVSPLGPCSAAATWAGTNTALLQITQTRGRAAFLEYNAECDPASCLTWLTDEEGRLLGSRQRMLNGSAELGWPADRDPDAITGHVAYHVHLDRQPCTHWRSAAPTRTWRGLVETYSSSNRNGNHDEDPDAVGVTHVDELIPRLNVSFHTRTARACVDVPASAPVHFVFLRSAPGGRILAYRDVGVDTYGARTVCVDTSLSDEPRSLFGCAAVANTLVCSPSYDLMSDYVHEIEEAVGGSTHECARCFTSAVDGFGRLEVARNATHGRLTMPSCADGYALYARAEPPAAMAEAAEAAQAEAAEARRTEAAWDMISYRRNDALHVPLGSAGRQPAYVRAYLYCPTLSHATGAAGAMVTAALANGTWASSVNHSTGVSSAMLVSNESASAARLFYATLNISALWEVQRAHQLELAALQGKMAYPTDASPPALPALTYDSYIDLTGGRRDPFPSPIRPGKGNVRELAALMAIFIALSATVASCTGRQAESDPVEARRLQQRRMRAIAYGVRLCFACASRGLELATVLGLGRLRRAPVAYPEGGAEGASSVADGAGPTVEVVDPVELEEEAAAAASAGGRSRRGRQDPRAPLREEDSAADAAIEMTSL